MGTFMIKPAMAALTSSSESPNFFWKLNGLADPVIIPLRNSSPCTTILWMMEWGYSEYPRTSVDPSLPSPYLPVIGTMSFGVHCCVIFIANQPVEGITTPQLDSLPFLIGHVAASCVQISEKHNTLEPEIICYIVICSSIITIITSDITIIIVILLLLFLSIFLFI